MGGQAAGRAARPFEQPVDRLSNFWSYILFDRTDRRGLIPVRSFLSPLSHKRILCIFTPAPVPPAPAPSLHAPPRPHPPRPYPSCSHMSRPGPLYPRTPRPHSLDHGATGTLTPCDALNMGLAWWLQEGSTSDTNSYPIRCAVAMATAASTRTGGGSCPRITRGAGRHSLWPPACRRHPRAVADEPKSTGGLCGRSGPANDDASGP